MMKNCIKVFLTVSVLSISLLFCSDVKAWSETKFLNVNYDNETVSSSLNADKPYIDIIEEYLVNHPINGYSNYFSIVESSSNSGIYRFSFINDNDLDNINFSIFQDSGSYNIFSFFLTNDTSFYLNDFYYKNNGVYLTENEIIMELDNWFNSKISTILSGDLSNNGHFFVKPPSFNKGNLFILPRDLYITGETFRVLYSSTFDIVIKPFNNNIEKFAPLKYDGVIYGIDSYFPLYFNPGPGPVELKECINDNDYNQMKSFDIYIKKDYPFEELDFRLDIDFLENNIGVPSLSSFKFYGLIKENGLYHWEEISYNHLHAPIIDDYSDTLNGSNYVIDVKALLDLTIYEEVKISIIVDNMLDFTIDYFDNGTSSVSYEINYIGSSYCRSNSNNNRYVIFTSDRSNINGSVFISNSDGRKVFVDYFNTKNFEFSGYTSFHESIYNNMYQFLYLNIGTENKKGFWLLRNEYDIFDYYFYINNSHLYYSYNNSNNLENSTFIDENGSIIINDLTISIDDVHYKNNFGSITDVFDLLSKDLFNNGGSKTFVLNCFEIFFSNMPICFITIIVLILFIWFIIKLFKMGGFK